MSLATVKFPDHDLERRIRNGLAPVSSHWQRRFEEALWGTRFSSSELMRRIPVDNPAEEVVTVTTSVAVIREHGASGILRRLMAGVYSFEERAFGRPSEDDFPVKGGEVWFDATSNGGWWSQRGWRVSARLDWAGDHVIVRNALVSVRSKSSSVWTNFDGETVDQLVEKRIQTLLAQLGFLTEARRQDIDLANLSPWADKFDSVLVGTLYLDGVAVLMAQDGCDVVELAFEGGDTRDFCGTPQEARLARLGWEAVTTR